MNCKTTILAIALAATVMSGQRGFAQNYGWPEQSPPAYPGAGMYGVPQAGYYAAPPTGNYAMQPAGDFVSYPTGFPAMPPAGYAPMAPAGYAPVQPAGYAPMQPAYPPGQPAGFYGMPPTGPFPAQPAAYYGPPADAGFAPPQMFADGQLAPIAHDYGHMDSTFAGDGTGGCFDDGAVYYPWRSWGSVDLLYWTRQGRSLPPLVSTSPPGTPRNAGPTNPIAATIGQPTTSILFGGDRVNDNWHGGVQIELGTWLDDHREIGIGMRVFAVDEDEVSFSATSAGTTILGRPFFNTQIGKEDALLVAFTNADPTQGPFTAGTVTAVTKNQLYGGDGFLRVNWGRGFGYSVDIVGGYQYTRINDSLIVTHDFRDLGTGDEFFGLDSFSTRNDFHGGEFGISAEFQQGPWTLNTLGKLGLGNSRQAAIVSGTNTADFVGFGTITTNGALLTQNSNIGTYKQDQFTFVPHVSLDVGYQVNDNLNVSLGYSFIYWSSVLLAGDQIDRNIDTRQFFGATVPDAQGPFFNFNDTDWWVQGINAGINGRF